MDFLKTKETGFKGPGEIRVRGRSLKILKDIYADNSLKNEERIDPGIFWHDEEYGLSQRDATEALSYLDKVGLIKIVPPKVEGAGLAGSVVEKITGFKEGVIKHFYFGFPGTIVKILRVQISRIGSIRLFWIGMRLYQILGSDLTPYIFLSKIFL